MNHKYEGEPVRVTKGDLNLALSLRDKIHKKELTTKQANRLLNNELILI